MPINNDNLGIAFGLVIGAGGATAVGASVVFSPRLVELASRKTLAASLGLSAGVMTYVSFIEIFQKSVGSFEDAGHSEDDSYLYATGCFFAGVVFMVGLNSFVTHLLGGHHHHHDHHHDHDHQFGKKTVTSNSVESDDQKLRHRGPSHNGEGDVVQNAEVKEDEVGEDDVVVPLPCCATQDPDVLQRMAAEMENNDDANQSREDKAKGQDDANLMRMSLNTALAVTIHNFPEGLATFVATLDDPAVGAVLAIAIAIHNIPEGLCVAMPVYYATGNRWQAFGWAVLSGAAEPIAALLGWAVLANSFSDTLYAILFGMVGGMMVIISVRELMPTAHRYDPHDSVVTYSFIAGMTIMALSLVLFIV